MKQLLLALGLFVLGFVPSVQADDSPVLNIEDAYALATSDVQKNGAVFMHITNDGPEAVRIVAAKGDVAEKIELHTHIMDGDVMQMREVEGYDIPAGETVMLKPMGHHIMLMGLKQPLHKGDVFTLTLETEGGQEIPVEVAVKLPGDVD